jgi:Xaa-Pro aminopeptidase
MLFVPCRAALVTGLVLVGLALTLLTGCGSDSSKRRGQASAVPQALVTVQAGQPGRRVPFGFLGLSFEYRSVEDYAGTDPSALNPVFVALVRNLVPGQAPVLRIGGDTADRTWWPTPGLARPPGVRFAITDRWLAVTRALADALRARVIFGLNLEADSPPLAAAEAAALINAIGPGATRALELGNEPDLYGTFPWYRTPSGQHVTGRRPGYDMAGLIGDFTRFSAALPAAVLAGPSLGGLGWTRDLGRFLAAEPRVGLVTLHRYPLQRCYTPRSSPRYPTLGHLLSSAASIGLADSFAPYAAVARAHGLSLRIDELNSVSCGADPAVSDTFASALWALNTLFEMVRVGIHGVNVHTFPGAGYELFQVSDSHGRWEARVAPEYYGLTLFARAAPAGSRLLEVSQGRHATLHVWATRSENGTIQVLAVNTGAVARPLSVKIAGARPGEATVQSLTAPSVSSSGGVRLAGQTFASPTFTGLFAGAPQTFTLSPVDGRYALRLSAGSAALLVFAPAASPPPDKMSALPDLLIYGDTIRHAELRHELPLAVPDPLLYAEIGGGRHVVASSLEHARIAEVDGGLDVHGLEEYGFDELVLSSTPRDEAQLTVMVRACHALGLNGAAVPAEFPIELADGLRAAGIELIVDRELFADRRRVKSEAELAGIRRAQTAAEAGMRAAAALLRRAEPNQGRLIADGEPLTSERVREAIKEAVVRAGASPGDELIVAHGAQGASGHEFGSGPIRPGEPVIVDLWPRDPESACFADMTRTFVVGEAPDELRRYHELTRESLARSLAVVRAGAEGREIHRVSCEPYEQAGLPTVLSKVPGQMLDEGFYHSLGHGVGLQVHEAPTLGRAPDRLVAGDVVTLEPGCYRPGFGGCRLEDLVIVTENGAELLTDFPYDLEP